MKKTVVIPILQDGLGEGDEVFTVVLSNPQGGLKLGNPSSAPVTIVDDEVVIQFNGKFKNNQPVVVRTGPLTANVSVDYFAASGTAILGEDFVLPPGTLVFPPGVSERTIPISTINDNIAEGPETFTITLTNPSPPAQLGPFVTQLFTLDDNDFGGTVGFGNTSVTAMPGQTKSLNIVRSKDGAGTVMTVGWAAVGGTAVPGVDFSPASGQVTFTEGDFSLPFAVTLSASPAAAGKTIVFGLMPPGLNATPPSSKLGANNVSTLTIIAPVVQFERTAYAGNEGTAVTITARRTGGPGAFTVAWSAIGGNATAGADYTPSSGTLSFGANDSSKSFMLNLLSDALVEGAETVVLGLNVSSGLAMIGANASTTVTIHDVAPSAYTFSVLYEGADVVSLPSISNNQAFGFSVNEDGVRTVFTGNLDTSGTDLRTAITLPTATVLSLRGERFPVDSGERVAFVADLPLSKSGIVLASNTSAASVAYQETTGGALSDPSISFNGTLAFRATVSCESLCETVKVSDSEGGFFDVAQTGVVTDVGTLSAFGPYTAVNDVGTVAFKATTGSGVTGIFTANAIAITAVNTIVDETFIDYASPVSINSAGQVAFIGIFQDGASVAVASNGSTVQLVTTGEGGFTGFGHADAGAVINDNGDVAFVGAYSGGHAIFVGSDPVNGKVVATGDVIDGHTVSSLELGGFNTNGQLAFRAIFTDGRFAAVVATPSQ